MEDNTNLAQGPNTTLAILISEKLHDGKLIAAKDRAAITAKLTSGSASLADWLQWVENKIDADDRIAGGANEN